MRLTKRTATLATMAALWIAGAAQAADEVNVAFFLEWPTPNLNAKAEGGAKAFRQRNFLTRVFPGTDQVDGVTVKLLSRGS